MSALLRKETRERNRCWKGGTHINNCGYRVVRLDGRYQLEHRVVMERALGRALLSSELVHHINEDRADNRIENLCLTTRGKHFRDHHRGRNRLNRWARDWDACKECRDKEYRHNAHGYCVRCYAKWYERRTA